MTQLRRLSARAIHTIALAAVSLVGPFAQAPGQTLTLNRGLFNTQAGISSDQYRQLAKDSMIVSILADGNARTLLGQSASSSNGGSASGALGLVIGRYYSNLTMLLNVKGSADTIKSNFGGSLLFPVGGGAGGGQLSALIDYRKIFGGGSRFGSHFYGGVAQSVWTASSPSGTPEMIGALPVMAGAQLSYEIINQPIAQETIVSLVLDGGVALRAFGGELSSEEHRVFRVSTLGVDREQFVLGEFGATLAVNDVRAGVSVYLARGGAPGLGHGQAVFGISVANRVLSQHTSRAAAPAI